MNDDARQVADALYTAVTSRRPELVRSCEKTVQNLASQGTLSSGGADALKAIIAQADAGEWQKAAEQLDKIIRAEP